MGSGSWLTLACLLVDVLACPKKKLVHLQIVKVLIIPQRMGLSSYLEYKNSGELSLLYFVPQKFPNCCRG